MSTQQDIYAAGSESHPPMLNKENYVPWSSRLLRYTKSRPNGKLIHNSIINGPYVRRMIPEPGDTNREVPVNETFHVQTDDELTEKELKQIKLMIKLFRPFFSVFLKKSMQLLIVVKLLRKSADYTQLYDFLKYNQKEVDELKYERLANTQDPLALMATSNNPNNFPVLNQDQPSFNQNYMHQPMLNPKDITDPTTAINMELALMAKAFKLNYSTPTNNNQRISSNPRNRQIAQPGMNMGQDRQMQIVGGNGENQFRQYVGQNVGNLNGYNAVQNVANQVIQNVAQNLRVQNTGNQNGLIGVPRNVNQNLNGNGNLVAARAEGNAVGRNGNQIRCYNYRGVGHFARNCTVRPRRRDAAYLQTQLLIAQKEEAGIQLQDEEFDLMAAAADLDEIEEVNANCILMANLQQASTLGTQTNKAHVYDSDGSAEYIEPLEPIPEPHQVPQNDNNVFSEVTSMEQSRETVEQHPANVKETRALYHSLYQNFAIEVEKVNTVNRKLKETNADLTTELARFKNQEKCFQINLNKQLSKEKSIVSFLLEEKKKLKSDFKTRKDELLDKQIQFEKKIKELNNILAKTGQSIQTIHMPSPKPDSFYHTEQKMALGYQNPFYLKQAQKKQQSLYDGKVLLEKHDPPVMHDLEETLQLAQESRQKMKQLNKEIKPANFTKINHLSGVFVSQTAKLRKELYFSNDSKTANVSKSISIPNEEFLDYTTLSVARKFLNENDRVPSASKSSQSQNKDAEVEEHHRNLLLSKNNKHLSLACNNIKLDSQDVISKVVCAMYKKCLISVNHDKCLCNYVNGKNSCGNKQKAKVSVKEIQKKYQPKVSKPKKVGTRKSLATPKPRKSRLLLRWSPTGRLFNQEGKIVDSCESKINLTALMVIQICLWCVDSGCSKHMTGNLKLLINFVWKFMGTVHFENDHVAAILGFGCSKHMTRNLKLLINFVWKFMGTVYFGNDHMGFGQFCDSDLDVTFRRNACFVRNLEGVDLLKGDRLTNPYTINLHEMASASPICLMARASSTKSWLWHQRLSHLNFDTINGLAKNDHVSGLLKFKYHKEHLCPSCEQGKRKRASHPTKPVPNSSQVLHLLQMDLCGPMRISSINVKRYVLVIVDDYSRYTWFPVIIIRTNNGTEFKNQVLKEYFDSVGISHQMSSVRTPQQNGVVERRNRTLVEAARAMLIFSRAPLFLWAEAVGTACFTQNCSIIHRHFNKTPYELINGKKPDISFLYLFGALCYPKNDCEDIGKLGAKGDIGFFIGYSVDSCAYRVYNRRTKKIMETMNVSFDELLGLDLTYAPSTITTQQTTEGELDLLFEAMYDDFIGGQPSAAQRTFSAIQAQQVRQTSSTSTTIADSTPTPTNSSSQATNFPNISKDVDELTLQQQHVQQQGNQAHLQSEIVADNVPNATFDGNTFAILLQIHPQVLLNHHLRKMWIHRTCIRFINHTLMNFNGLRIILWNK
nr:hypothetical protein [Tanacetum cinerariifolium]